MTPASSSASRLGPVAALLPQAPSGAGAVSRRAPVGSLLALPRQSSFFFFSGTGTAMMRRQLGHGVRLPARSLGTSIASKHIGHSKPITAEAAASVPASAGSSASAAAAAASTSSTGGGGGGGGGGGPGAFRPSPAVRAP